MYIESITMHELHMPLVHFFETSFGRTTERRVLLVELKLDGISAWGECVAGEHPYYSEESLETAWYVIQDELAPALLGRDIRSGRDVPDLLKRVRGHRMAKASLENAVWEAEAEAKGVPLWNLLGGVRREIACGVSLGIQNSIEQLLSKTEEELAAGYQRIKLKCKPGWDLKIFERVRARWPEILLSCDANSVYTLDDVEHLKQFDKFNLLMIEQPLWNDDFYFHATLQKQLKTRICLDEAIHHARSARAAIELGSSRSVGSGVLARPLRFTTWLRQTTFPCGAVACWRAASDVPTTWRSRHCQISLFRAMFQLGSGIGRKTSSNRKSQFPEKERSQ